MLNRDAVTRAGAGHRSHHAMLQSVLLMRLWQQSCDVAARKRGTQLRRQGERTAEQCTLRSSAVGRLGGGT